MDQEVLEIALKSDLLTKKAYSGCFCRDELPKIASNSIYLINTSTKLDILGEHWTSIDTRYDGKVLWLCSYNTHPKDFNHIWRRICDTKRKLITFPRRLQAPNLTNCGVWTCFFIFMTSRGLTPQDMMEYYFEGRDIYKLNIWVTVVTQTLFHLKGGIKQLLYNSSFAAEQEKLND